MPSLPEMLQKNTPGLMGLACINEPKMRTGHMGSSVGVRDIGKPFPSWSFFECLRKCAPYCYVRGTCRLHSEIEWHDLGHARNNEIVPPF